MHLAEMGCKQMAVYYAVIRDSSPLVHYGIKGMHWGVQRAIRRSNKHAWNRQYKKAEKRLHKLEKRAASGARYTRRAVMRGARASGTAGLVLAGMQNPGVLAYKAGVAGYNAYRAANAKNGNAAKKAQEWRDVMEKEFNIDAFYAGKKPRHRGRKSYS